MNTHLYPEIQSLQVKSMPENCDNNDVENKDILMLLNKQGKRKDIRKGNLVDQFWTQKYIDFFSNPIFSTLDCKAKNVINIPLGFMPHAAISQCKKYPFIQHDNNQYFGKIFWRGRILTHEIRSKIIPCFLNKRSQHVDIDLWNIDGEKYGIYGEPNKCQVPKEEYSNYFEGLKNSDFFLVIRGDLPWTFSFMDCIRAGAVPICIDTFYQNMGWENIGIRSEDLFLSFNTDMHTVEEIYDKCLEILQDQERVLYMKNNVNKFYKKYILNDREFKSGCSTNCWRDFIAAKIIEIQRNDHQLVNNQFISAIVNEIKE